MAQSIIRKALIKVGLAKAPEIVHTYSVSQAKQNIANELEQLGKFAQAKAEASASTQSTIQTLQTQVVGLEKDRTDATSLASKVKSVI